MCLISVQKRGKTYGRSTRIEYSQKKDTSTRRKILSVESEGNCTEEDYSKSRVGRCRDLMSM